MNPHLEKLIHDLRFGQYDDRVVALFTLRLHWGWLIEGNENSADVLDSGGVSKINYRPDELETAMQVVQEIAASDSEHITIRFPALNLLSDAEKSVAFQIGVEMFIQAKPDYTPEQLSQITYALLHFIVGTDENREWIRTSPRCLEFKQALQKHRSSKNKGLVRDVDRVLRLLSEREQSPYIPE